MTAGQIEWTGQTWNPIVGCDIRNAACTHCYAMRMARRLEAMSVAHEAKHGSAGPLAHYRGTTKLVNGNAVWTGQVNRAPDYKLTEPLRRKKPTLWFVNSMSDLFHDDVPDEWIDRIFAVMALCPQHHFQLLTKRWERMREYCTRFAEGGHHVDSEIWKIACPLPNGGYDTARLKGPLGEAARVAVKSMTGSPGRPEYWLPNVSLGVSVHDQDCANLAIPALLATPAALRFVSYEPALGPVDWCNLRPDAITFTLDALTGKGEHLLGMIGQTGKLDLIIAGDESGEGKRPADPNWYRQSRDPCEAAGVPFFLKQMHVGGRLESCPELDGQRHTALPQAWRALLN